MTRAGRPKGYGTIYYDKKKKRFIANYRIMDKETHKEKRLKKIFRTEQEAQEFLSTLNYQKGNELFIENNGIPLNQLMRAHLKKKLDMNLISESQFARVEKTIEVIEKSDLSKRKIDEISSDDIQDYLNTLTDYSNSYIKMIFEQFSQSYKFAVNRGYIIRNPLVDVIKPKSKKPNKIVRALELEEQQKFTEYLMNKTIEEEPYKNLFLLQMYCGLRVGEACALRNTDINLQKNLIKVDKTLTTDKNGAIVMGSQTKTYAGMREIPIPEFIRDSIIEQMRIAENHKDKQLFLSQSGRYIDSRNVNSILKNRLKKLGIEGISTHSLRHTYGTRCVEAGMRAVALQRLMGHTDVGITLNTYTSVFNRYKESELEKVNQYYMNNELFKNTKPQQMIEDIKVLKSAEDNEELEDFTNNKNNYNGNNQR